MRPRLSFQLSYSYSNLLALGKFSICFASAPSLLLSTHLSTSSSPLNCETRNRFLEKCNSGHFPQASPPVAAAGPGHLLLSMLRQPTSTLQVRSSCLGLGNWRDGARRTCTSKVPISHVCVLTDLTRAVNALPQNMTSQMFSAIAAVTGQGQNPNATPAQWASSQYGYGGSGGGSSAYHVRGLGRGLPAEVGKE